MEKLKFNFKKEDIRNNWFKYILAALIMFIIMLVAYIIVFSTGVLGTFIKGDSCPIDYSDLIYKSIGLGAIVVVGYFVLRYLVVNHFYEFIDKYLYIPTDNWFEKQYNKHPEKWYKIYSFITKYRVYIYTILVISSLLIMFYAGYRECFSLNF